MNVNHYTYRLEWSPDHGEYVGRCLEIPFLTHWAPTAVEAATGVICAVDEHLALLTETGEAPPTPLTERAYSGRVLIRTSAALHARLAVEATEQGVSMNQWVVQRLSDRPIVHPLDW